VTVEVTLHPHELDDMRKQRWLLAELDASDDAEQAVVEHGLVGRDGALVQDLAQRSHDPLAELELLLLRRALADDLGDDLVLHAHPVEGVAIDDEQSQGREVRDRGGHGFGLRVETCRPEQGGERRDGQSSDCEHHEAQDCLIERRQGRDQVLVRRGRHALLLVVAEREKPELEPDRLEVSLTSSVHRCCDRLRIGKGGQHVLHQRSDVRC
jgi:hypothetical protein